MTSNQDRCERCGKFERGCGLVYDEDTDQAICRQCEVEKFGPQRRIHLRQTPDYDRRRLGRQNARLPQRDTSGIGLSSIYRNDRCCICYRPVADDAALVRLARTDDGEWWAVPDRPALPDEQEMGGIYTLPIGPDCLRQHPELRPYLAESPAAA